MKLDELIETAVQLVTTMVAPAGTAAGTKAAARARR
jgi:hypothetical protein